MTLGRGFALGAAPRMAAMVELVGPAPWVAWWRCVVCLWVVGCFFVREG